jgi:hypothetical protein
VPREVTQAEICSLLRRLDPFELRPYLRLQSFSSRSKGQDSPRYRECADRVGVMTKPRASRQTYLRGRRLVEDRDRLSRLGERGLSPGSERDHRSATLTALATAVGDRLRLAIASGAVAKRGYWQRIDKVTCHVIRANRCQCRGRYRVRRHLRWSRAGDLISQAALAIETGARLTDLDEIF